MASEAETPESVVVKMEDEGKICGQFGTVVNKASLGELQESEDGHRQQSETAENSIREEEHKVAQSFKNGFVNPSNEGKVGNPESDGFLESPLITKRASEETPNASKDGENESIPLLIKYLELENEMQIHEDQTKDTVEVTTDIIKGESIDACGQPALTEMSLDIARADVGLASSSELPTVQNDHENIGEKLPALPIASVSADFNLQEGKNEGVNSSVLDDMNEVPSDDKKGSIVEHLQSVDSIHHHLIENSGSCANQSIDEDKAVTCIQKDDPKGNESGENREFNSAEEESVVNNMDVEAYNQAEDAAYNQHVHKIPIKEEETQLRFQEEELECKGNPPNFAVMVKDPETIIQTEDKDDKNKDGVQIATEETRLHKSNTEEILSPETTSRHLLVETSVKPINSQKEGGDENGKEPEIQDMNIIDVTERVKINYKKASQQLEKEKPEMDQSHKKELESEMNHEDWVFKTNDHGNEIDETPTEEKNEGSKIIEESKGTLKDLKEDCCTVEDLTTISSREQQGNGSSKGDNEAKKSEGEMNEELGAMGYEHNEKQKKEENVTEALDIAGTDKDTGEPITEEDTPYHSRTTTGEERTKDYHEEYKIFGRETVDADKDKGESIEEIVVGHSTPTIGEEPLKDGNEEDKVIGGLEIANVDNDTQEPITEQNGVPDHSTTTIGEEPTKYVLEEDNVTDGLEIVDAEKNDRDQENVLTVSTTTIGEDAIKDGSEEDKAIEGLQVVDFEDIGDPIIDKDVPDYSTTTIGKEQIGYCHKEDMGLETVGVEKEIGEHIVEEDVSDQSIINISDKLIRDIPDEDEVIKGIEINEADKEIRESTIEDTFVPRDSITSTTTIRNVPIKDDLGEIDKVIEGLDIANGDKCNGEPATEDDVVSNHSTNIISDEPINDCYEEEKVNKGLEILSAVSGIRDPIIEEDVVRVNSICTAEDSIQDGAEEGTVTEGLSASTPQKAIGDPLVEENVALDDSTTTIEEEAIKASKKEDKVTEGLYIVDVDKHIEEPVIEENVVGNSTTTVGEKTIKDDHEEDKVTGGLETIDAVNDNGNPVIVENIVLDDFTIPLEEAIKDDNEKDKVTEGNETIDVDNDMKQLDTKECVDFTQTNVMEKSIKDDHEEDKVIEGLDASTTQKAIVDPIGDRVTEENVVLGDSTTTITKEPIEDGQKDNKVTERLYQVDVDKDNEQPIIEENVVVDNSTTTIGEATKEDHEEDKATEGLETFDSVNDIGEPVIEENVVLEHSTTTPMEVLKDDNEEDKVTKGKEIMDVDKDVEQLVIKESVNFSPTNVVEKEIKDDHEEDNVIDGLDVSIRHKVIEDPTEDHIFAVDVAQGDSTITKEPIEDGKKEDDVTKGLYLVDVDKDNEEPIIEKNVVVGNSTTTIGEEAIKDDHEDKVTEGFKTLNDIRELVSEDNVVLDHSTTTPMEEATKDDKIIEEIEITDEDRDTKVLVIKESVDGSPTNIGEKSTKDDLEEDKVSKGPDATITHKAIGGPVGDPIFEENVAAGDFTTTIKDEQIKYGQKEDKIFVKQVLEGLYIVDVDKHIEEAVIEENVVVDNSTTTIGEEAIKDDHEEDKVTAELKTVDAVKDIRVPVIEETVVLDHSTTTPIEEANKDDNEEDKVTEGIEITDAGKDIEQLVIKETVNLSTTSVGEIAIKDGHEGDKETGGLEIVDVVKDIGESFSEENGVIDHSNTIIGDEITKDSREEDKVTEGLETVDAKNDINQLGFDENVVLGHSATTSEEKVIKDGHEEDKVTERLEIVDKNKNLTEPIIEENVILDHSTMPIQEEAIEDDHENDKVNEELEILDTDKDTEEPVEENVVLGHFATTIRETIKDGYIEDKVTKKLEIADADKDIGQHVIEESDARDSTNIGEDAVKYDHEEDKVETNMKVNEGLEIVCTDRDIGVLVIEEKVTRDHSTTTNGEKEIKDGHEEDKVTEGLEIVDAAEENCESVIEENDVLDHSTPTIGGETIKDGHEEDKVTEGLEIAYANMDIEVPMIEKNVVQDHFTTSIVNKAVKDGHDEDKVTKGLEIVDADKDIGEGIIEENVVADHSITVITEEIIKDGHEEDKVTQGLQIVVDKDIMEPISEENIVLNHATIIIGEEATNDVQDDKVTEGLGIVDAKNDDIGEPLTGESVALDQFTTTIGEETRQNGHEEDKVLDGLEIIDADQDIGEPVLEKNVFRDHSTTTMREEATKHEEDKINEGLEIVDEDQDIRESVEEYVVLDHSTTTTGEEGMKSRHDEDKATEGNEDKVIEGFKVVGANKEIGKPKTEENVVQNHSITTIREEPTEDGHEHDKAIEVIEKDDKDEYFGEPVIQKDVDRDHFTTTIMEETVASGQKEDKAIERIDLVGVHKYIGGSITEENVGTDNSTTIGEEPIKDDHTEHKATKELEIAGANKEVEKAIIQEAVVPDNSTTTIRDESINDDYEEDKVIKSLKAAAEGEATEKEILEDDIVTDLYEEAIGDNTIKDISQEYEPHASSFMKACTNLAITEDDKQIMEDASITELSTISTREAAKENTQDDEMGEKEHGGKANEFDLPMESNFEASDSAQKVEAIMSRGEEEQNSENLNDTSTELIEATDMTNKIEMVNPEDVKYLHKSKGIDNIKEIAEEEIIHEERREMLDGISLVPHMSEEQKNEEIIEEGEEGNGKSLRNVYVEEETKSACSHETESEGTQLIELSDGLYTAASIADIENNTCEKEHGLIMNLNEHFTQEIIKTELADHLGDHGAQNKEVVAFSDLSSIEQNRKPVDLREENKWLALESPNKHNYGSTTANSLLENPAKVVADVLTNDKVQEEDGNKHDIESSEMSKGPEPAVSQSHREDIIDGAATLIQQSKTESMKLEKTGESDSIEVLEDNAVMDNSGETRTNKEKDSSTILDTDEVEGEVTHENNKAGDDAVNDQTTVPFRDEAVGQSWINDGKDKLNTDSEPVLEDEDQFQPGVVEQSTISKIHYEKVCGEVEYTEKEISRDISVKENSTYTLGEVIASKNSHKDEETSNTPGGEVEEPDSISKEEATYSTTQTEIVALEEEEDLKKCLDAFTALEDITKMETPTESTMAEEQVIEEILQKTDSKKHENICDALLTEKLSLHEAESESGEPVDAFGHASTETFSTTEENLASQDPDVENLKHKKTSKSTGDTFTVESKDATFEQEKSEIPVEASVAIQSDKDTETARMEEITAVKPSSDDISDEKPEESSMLVSTTHVLDKTGTKEKIKDNFLVEGEVIDKKIETSLRAQTEGETYMQTEEHIKLNEDSELGIENIQKISVTELDAERVISERKDGDVILEGEKVVELNKLSRLEISDPILKQNKLESEKKSDVFAMELETTDTCTDILEKEDPIKRLDTNLESKMHMKVEEILEVKATEHSHEINESYNITEKVTLAQKYLEEVGPCKVLNKSTESVEHDQNCWVPGTEETDVVKDRKLIKDRNVISVEDHTVRQNTKEEEKENDHLEDAGAEDQNDNTKPMKVLVMNEEMHPRVERDNKSENIEKQSIEEEASKAREVLMDNKPIKEVKSSEFISDNDNEATYCSERTKTETSAYVEELNVKADVNIDPKASEEEIHKQEGSEEHEEVFNAASKLYHDNVIKEIKEEEGDIADVFHIQPIIVVTEEKSENETIVEGFSTPSEVESKVAETINTEGDSIERINLDFVSQLPTFENGSLAPQCVTVDKDVKDNVESDIAVNTEENLEKDQKNAEAIIPREKIEPVELENPKNTIDHITSTHALAEETSAEEVGEDCKIDTVKNTEESDMHNEGAATGNDIIMSNEERIEKDPKRSEAVISQEKIEPSELENLQNTTDKIAITHSMTEDTSAGEVGEYCKIDSDFESDVHNEGAATSHDIVSIRDERAEAIFQEHKKGENIDEAKSESEDDQNNKPNEANMEAGKLLEEEFEVVPDEVIHGIISKTSENKENEHNDATDPERFVGDETPPGSMTDTNTMGVMEKLQGEEELPTNNCHVPSLTKSAQVQMQEKKGQNTEDEEKQEVVLVKKEENEMSLSAEESEENIEHKAPVAKINELSTEEKSCTDEEGETQHRKQPDIPQGSNAPDESSEATAAKNISIDEDRIGRIEEEISIGTIETSSTTEDIFGKPLLAAGVEEEKHGEAQVNNSEVSKVECDTDSLNEEANSDYISSSLGLLHNSKKEVVGQLEEEQSLIHNKNDQNKEETINKDIDVKTTPKKSHGMLSGVGSKVKHSISKVKKAISGKQQSPK